MGRRKQRSDKGEGGDKESPRRDNLEPAWPSGNKRPPRYCLYCINHDSNRQYIINSHALYAIRKIFDMLTAGHEKFDRRASMSHVQRPLISFGDIDISSDELDEIMKHKYTKDEDAWQLPAPYPNDIMNFLSGPRITQALEGHEVVKNEDGSKRVVAKERKPRVDRSQFITVQSLAEELDLDPRDARAALRKAKVVKPEGGWLGDEAWAKGIRDILVKAKKDISRKGKK